MLKWFPIEITYAACPIFCERMPASHLACVLKWTGFIALSIL